MGEQEAGRRPGEPGRRPAPVVRDGGPRRELAYWLRAALTEHGEPTLETLVRGLPDEARMSRSALAKGLRGETFPGLPVVRAVLATAGAPDDEIEAWTAYWHHLEHLEQRRRHGETVTADPPRWASPAAPGAADGDPAEPPSRRRPPVAVLVGCSALLGAALALGAVALGSGLLGSAADAGGGPPSATVLVPATTVAPATFRLVGAFRGLPEGTLLWAGTFDAGTGRWFPQDKPCVTRTDGSFDCGQYYLGRQDGPDTAPYRIDLFAADAGASNALLQYQIDKGGPEGADPGMAALPPGATVVGARDYTRS